MKNFKYRDLLVTIYSEETVGIARYNAEFLPTQCVQPSKAILLAEANTCTGVTAIKPEENPESTCPKTKSTCPDGTAVCVPISKKPSCSGSKSHHTHKPHGHLNTQALTELKRSIAALQHKMK